MIASSLCIWCSEKTWESMCVRGSQQKGLGLIPTPTCHICNMAGSMMVRFLAWLEYFSLNSNPTTS